MGESLASFRDLKGIGPATEARLHETGVYTWDALSTVATALASVRSSGDTPRDIANAIAARRAEAGEAETDPGPSNGGEHLEAFVLRLSLSADGEPQRSEVTHVRTMADRAWPGWQPVELAGFINEHAGIRAEVDPARESARQASARKGESPREAEPGDQAPAGRSPRRRHDAPPRQPSSADQVVFLDAGKTIGGTSRDINLVVTNTQSVGGDFGYRATLAARGLGRGRNGEGWSTLASRTGTGSPTDDLALGFGRVSLPPGVQRLQLRLEVSLPAASARAPALAVASA
ncbi:MAG TPA: hypothetical protein VFR22_00095 [Nocardioidaceae bacterium]|nr:hypothetical protein [Nocardioidaceae bacterium]